MIAFWGNGIRLEHSNSRLPKWGWQQLCQETGLVFEIRVIKGELLWLNYFLKPISVFFIWIKIIIWRRLIAGFCAFTFFAMHVNLVQLFAMKSSIDATKHWHLILAVTACTKWQVLLWCMFLYIETFHYKNYVWNTLCSMIILITPWHVNRWRMVSFTKGQ